MASVKKVLVVGGGIGGLSAGVALRQAGIEVDIAELHPTFDVYGVGIIQPSNALRALDSLGLADACLEQGSPYGPIDLHAPNGHKFTTIGPPPLGRFLPHNGISRRILHTILRDGAQAHGVNCRMNLSVTALDNRADGVDVTFTDGSTGTYDLVVGADGVNSKVRTLVFGPQKARYVGQSVWRYAFDRPAELTTGHMYMGRNTRVGLIPMTKDRMYMFLLSCEGENPAIPQAELLPRMKALLEGYTAPLVRQAAEQITDPAGIIYRPLETLLMPAPWYKNRVVIIGDAAHATIPQLGQGASLAIEDAVVLAELLATNQPVNEVLEQFMNRRFERCKMVVDSSNTVSEWEQLEWQGKLPEGANVAAMIGQASGRMGAPI
ncbi:FAD-dependent monooxygenase [Hymenobacter monticola]|uniref:FAD-dependent monooxygenase n=1 Tax=Hymenobacter monticola TaxID=1705399 RepID=A0ABY4BBH0_9BACT|nr:FAD-dependent monooxygenase [Hymenobacter monticola]UOE36498.1 FAD-dependent monooxygenase [Hymenobacter monticola]